MISVKITKKDKLYHEVYCIGHAGFAKSGEDIVCAAVSVLVINTINAIEQFTEDPFSVDTDPKTGLIDMVFTEDVSKEATLLLDTLSLGLTEIENQYGKKYFTLKIQEV